MSRFDDITTTATTAKSNTKMDSREDSIQVDREKGGAAHAEFGRSETIEESTINEKKLLRKM